MNFIFFFSKTFDERLKKADLATKSDLGTVSQFANKNEREINKLRIYDLIVNAGGISVWPSSIFFLKTSFLDRESEALSFLYLIFS